MPSGNGALLGEGDAGKEMPAAALLAGSALVVEPAGAHASGTGFPRCRIGISAASWATGPTGRYTRRNIREFVGYGPMQAAQRLPRKDWSADLKFQPEMTMYQKILVDGQCFIGDPTDAPDLDCMTDKP